MVRCLLVLLVQVLNSLLVLLGLRVLARFIQLSIWIVQTSWVQHLLRGQLSKWLWMFLLLKASRLLLLFTTWFRSNLELLLIRHVLLLHLLLRVYRLMPSRDLVLRQLTWLGLDYWAVASYLLLLLMLGAVGLMSGKRGGVVLSIYWGLVCGAAPYHLVLSYAVLLLERVWWLRTLFQRPLWR